MHTHTHTLIVRLNEAEGQESGTSPLLVPPQGPEAVAGVGIEGTRALCLERLEEGLPKLPGVDQRCCRAPAHCRFSWAFSILQLEIV